MTSPEGTLVFLERFVDEHVSLHFVLPVERGLTEGALVRLLTWEMEEICCDEQMMTNWKIHQRTIILAISK